MRDSMQKCALFMFGPGVISQPPLIEQTISTVPDQEVGTLLFNRDLDVGWRLGWRKLMDGGK